MVKMEFFLLVTYCMTVSSPCVVYVSIILTNTLFHTLLSCAVPSIVSFKTNLTFEADQIFH